MRKKMLILLVVLLVVFLLGGCDTNNDYNVTIVEENGKWITETYEQDETIYKMIVRIESPLESYQAQFGNVNGYLWGGYGSISGGMWTEGKGMVPVTVLAINPFPDQFVLRYGDRIVIKTEDLKFKGLGPGDEVEIACYMDLEFVGRHEKTASGGEKYTMEPEIVYEFDGCRMTNPIILSYGEK